MSSNSSPVCFIVDVNIAWIAAPLRRRGFLVFEPYRDYPADADDSEILEYAVRTGCIVVSHDMFFLGKPNSVYVPHDWEKRYNSWDLVTKIVKLASKKYYESIRRSD